MSARIAARRLVALVREPHEPVRVGGRARTPPAPPRVAASPVTYGSRWPRPVQRPWHGRPSWTMTTWPSSTPPPRAPRNGAPLEITPPPRPVPSVSMTRSSTPRAGADPPLARSPPRSRRCRARPAARTARAMWSRSGKSWSGRLTMSYVAARPRGRSAPGTPRPIAATSSSSSSAIAASSSASERLLRIERRRPLVPAHDLAVARDDAGEDLRPAEVDADRVRAAPPSAGTVTRRMAASGEKPYRVYRGGRTKGKVPLAGDATASARRRPRRRRRPGGRSAPRAGGWTWKRWTLARARRPRRAPRHLGASPATSRCAAASSDANKRLPAGTTSVLAKQNGLHPRLADEHPPARHRPLGRTARPAAAPTSTPTR